MERVVFTNSENLTLVGNLYSADSDSKLEIIDGANHSFFDHYDILIDLANDWFIKHL